MLGEVYRCRNLESHLYLLIQCIRSHWSYRKIIKKHQIEEAPFFSQQLINHFSHSRNLFCKNIPKNTLNRYSVLCVRRTSVEKLARDTSQFVLKL